MLGECNLQAIKRILLILFIFNKYYVKYLTMSKERIRWIVTTGALAAIEVILQIIGNVVAFGPISINLSLIPIAVGAILMGPWCGLFLGAVNGIAVILAPSTLATFMPLNAFGTILICMLKAMAAGFLSGLLFLVFKGKKIEIVGMIICSLIIPIINTSIFIGGCYLFFKDWLTSTAEKLGFVNPFLCLILVIIGWNFIFEFSTSIVFSPTICKVVQIARNKQKASA